ncbi:MAG: hypothetical protein QXM86_01350 [Candidatus Bathyarchaeia archaeon]
MEFEAPFEVMLKGCLWMGRSEGISDDEQDEDSQQPARESRRQKLLKATFFSNIFHD